MAQIDFLSGVTFQGVDNNGVPIDGGLVWCYLAGTDDLGVMYSTITDAINQTNPIENPVVLDSGGRASIVYAGASKFVLENNDIDPDTGHGTVIWSDDNIGRFGNTVIDPNGHIIVEYGYVTDAVNYIEILNAATGEWPIIEAHGGDLNVGLILKTIGTGGIKIQGPTSEYTLPASDGITGTFLKTDGSGNVSWDVPTASGTTIPPGSLLDYAGTVLPTGWLACDGSAVSRATYSALFTAIGTTWGAGDGVNTFNLPNLQRRVKVGSGGSGTGTLGNAVGNTGGEETHTLIIGEMPAHQHNYSTVVPNVFVAAAGAALNVFQAPTQTTPTAVVGGDGAHNNIQPSAVVMSIIKV